MRSNRVCLLTVFTTAILLWLAASAASAQGLTTSSISGQLLDSARNPVGAAAVTATHEPSGTVYAGTTRGNGRFSLSGLRVGGPYTIVAGAGGDAKTEKEVYLSLGSDRTVEFSAVEEDVVVLEKFNISAETTGLQFDPSIKGAGSHLGLAEIQLVPTVDLSIQDFVSLDPRITTMDPERGEINVAGQNFRFNTVLIDGVPFNDPFGINAGGLPSLGNPISLRFIEQFNIQISPYDTRYSGFTGGLINMVTKSGTNHYHGSAWYLFRNKNMRAPNRIKQSPQFGQRESFERTTWGLTFGGPIIKDKLFFFLGYERFEENLDVPTAQFAPSAAALAQIVDRAKALGYEPGALFGGENLLTNDKYFAKLDWNISAQHRLSATYFETKDLDPQFPNYSGASDTSLSNHWYDENVSNTSYVAQLFSSWTPDFRTEARVSFSEYRSRPQNAGEPFPAVRITNVPSITGSGTGSVRFGTENSRQTNILEVDTLNGMFAAEYFTGNHTIVLGVDAERNDTYNLFVQDTMGNYTYNSVADWVTGGRPSLFTYQYAREGQDPAADFTQTIAGLFLSDRWQVNDRLSIEGGLRLDYPMVDKSPAYNPAFEAAFGRRNDATIDGNYTISPRLGFNYSLTRGRRVQIRGGVGHFRGKVASVWLANSFQNTGVQLALNNTPPPNFVADPAAQPTGTPANSRARVSLADPDFDLPAVWRGNLGFDYELPWLGTVFTAEVIHSVVDKGIGYVSLNMVQTGTGPDGRPIFNNLRGGQRQPGFEGVYLIRNANDGESTYSTIALERPMKDSWSASLAYTRGKSTEVSPVTSSVAESNWNNRMIFDPNELSASTSNYEVTNRVQLRTAYRFTFFGPKARTTLSALYEGHTGRPYSWVFFNDANRDANITMNDLFYVPTGPDDPKTTWANASQRDDFFRFVENSGLKDHKGKVVPRNSERSPWIDRVDLQFSQELPLWRTIEAEFSIAVINVLNLINDEWGLVKEVPFSFGRRVASGTYNSSTNTYAYSYSGADIIRNRNTESRWQIQAGIELRF